MDRIILEIVELIRAGEAPGERRLGKLIRSHNRDVSDSRLHIAKKMLLPHYLHVKQEQPQVWASWGIDPQTEAQLVRVLQVKPRRTASGVATISVLTKPWACGGTCIYCPNDVRMPKSYLASEPACQRAEHNWFDPYLQVAVRLRALDEMGHPTDKVELIVLGGTWDDYPSAYRIWFVRELFRALNDGAASWDRALERRRTYQQLGLPCDPDELARQTAAVQARVDAGELPYNLAVDELYGGEGPWSRLAARQTATLGELEQQQRINETARHRVVGLVVETRPDAITPQSLTLMRQLGCTKVQVGVQSTRQEVLDLNARGLSVQRIQQAFELVRAFGFKMHAHAMANLLGSTPHDDLLDYRTLVESPAFAPDEVKLYPCTVIPSAQLAALHASGAWQAYPEEQLVDLLARDVLATPEHVRVSRMIRDIPSQDIVAGNKKTNLRQMVEQRIQQMGMAPQVREIRMREVAGEELEVADLELVAQTYATTNSREVFLQWVTPQGRIAGFLRLSLPSQGYVEEHAAELPVGLGQAMIREVHVYGRSARLTAPGDDGSTATTDAADGTAAPTTQHAAANAQHRGLGRQLVEEACRLAREAGYSSVNVISAVGTREYYRKLGFADAGLYQRRMLG